MAIIKQRPDHLGIVCGKGNMPHIYLRKDTTKSGTNRFQKSVILTGAVKDLD